MPRANLAVAAFLLCSFALSVALLACKEDPPVKAASLELRLVHQDNERLCESYSLDPDKFIAPAGFSKMELEEKDGPQGGKASTSVIFVDRKVLIDGKSIADAYLSKDYYGRRVVMVSFNAEGTRSFAKTTEESIGRRIAIILDGKCTIAPVVKCPITGGCIQIGGTFSKEDGRRLCKALIQAGRSR